MASMRFGLGRRETLRSGVILGVLAIGASAAAISACVGDDPSTTNPTDGGGSDASSGDATSPNDGSTPNDGAVTPDAGPSVTDVAFGFASACALLSDGTVSCWGDDGEGELAVPGVALPSVPACANCRPTPAVIGGLSNIKQISIGQQSCAVDGIGDVYCWGVNDVGQLGHDPGTSGDTTCPGGGAGKCNLTPTKVAGVSSVTKVVVGGSGVTCALTSGHAIYCWGGNSTLALSETDASAFSSAPALIPGFTGKTITDFNLALNAPAVCAVVQGEGVYCWAFNNNGELGHNPGTAGDITLGGIFSANPTPAIVNTTTAITPNIDCTDITSVAEVQGSSCGLTFDGGVKCWGDNQFGQFANQSYSPGNLAFNSILRSNAANLTQLSGNGGNDEGTYCGIDNTQHVVCWGASDYGQLGNGTDTLVDGGATHDAGAFCQSIVHCADTPQPIPTPVTIKKISVGWCGVAALGTDGKVYTWGYNGNGQLGHAPLTNGDDGACVSPPAGGTGAACNPRPTVVNGLR